MQQEFSRRGALRTLYRVKTAFLNYISPIGVLGHAGIAFLAFSIGAVLRHHITGEIPGEITTLAITAWGWPIGVPLYMIAGYLVRPLP